MTLLALYDYRRKFTMLWKRSDEAEIPQVIELGKRKFVQQDKVGPKAYLYAEQR